MKLVTRVLVIAFALLVVAHLMPGITVTGLVPALLAALVLGLLNAIVRPILVILTLPITLLTLGLFILVINAGLFALAASFVPGFFVRDFLAAVIGSLLMAVISFIVNRII